MAVVGSTIHLPQRVSKHRLFKTKNPLQMEAGQMSVGSDCLMAEYSNRETGASSGCTNANARVDTELI